MWNWTETFSTVVGIGVYYSVHNSWWWWWWWWVNFTPPWSRCCRYLGNSPQDLYRTYDTFKDMWTSNRLALDAIILRAIRGQKRSNKGVCVCVQLKCEFCRLVHMTCKAVTWRNSTQLPGEMVGAIYTHATGLQRPLRWVIFSYRGLVSCEWREKRWKNKWAYRNLWTLGKQGVRAPGWWDRKSVV